MLTRYPNCLLHIKSHIVMDKSDVWRGYLFLLTLEVRFKKKKKANFEECCSNWGTAVLRLIFSNQNKAEIKLNLNIRRKTEQLPN